MKGGKTERVRRRDNPFPSSLTILVGTKPGPSKNQKLRFSSGIPTWVVKTQIFGPLYAAIPGT